MKILLLTLALAVYLASARMHLSHEQELRLNEELGLDEEYYWYEQRLDHFNPQVNTTWQQRFFDIDQYWDPETGPLFLYICGEGRCRQPSEKSFAVNLAKTFKGRILALEHRFYGMSHPTEDWSTENLQYLTPDQGLADLAQFATSKSEEFSEEYGIPHRRWITVGGSYPGAMSAWFRYKFPHIAMGSLASSAVVEAIADYHQYDEQVYVSTLRSGIQCPEKWINVTQYIVNKMNNGEKQDVFKNFGFSGDMPNGAFYYFLGDLVAGPVQSGSRVTFCNDLGSITSDPAMVYKWLAYFAQQVGIKLSDYAVGYLQNTTIDFDKNARQWTYQTCANLGYFQTPAEHGTPMRGPDIDISFWREYCKAVYEIDIFPDTDHYNLRYGGKDLAATRIIFTNGAEDPWQHASIVNTTNPYITPIMIDCAGCAHCMDLRDAKDFDPPGVTNARKQIKEIIGEWLKHEIQVAEKKFPTKAQSSLRELLVNA